MLNSGERQVTTALSEIRRDHVARYEWAKTQIKPGSKVLDFACGIGYGTKMLADAGNEVIGFDNDVETIAFATEHFGAYGHQFFVECNGNAPGGLPNADAIVSFETIEHIEDPRPLLLAMRQAAPTLLVSVPNEDVMPWRREDGSTTAFHFRHYTKLQFEALLAECGWVVTSWYGQLGAESDVEYEVFGRTLIARCERSELLAQQPDRKHIAIVGLGPSSDQYLDIVKRQGGRHRFCDETWTINALGDVLACDLIFHMDDIRIQEIRAAARPASNIAAMVDWLKNTTTPVMTSREHPDYPMLVAFPLEDVLNTLGHDYFNNTGAYAVAYAIYCGATDISLFGMDYSYANVHDAEKGRACVEFWLGYAHARGIKINMPDKPRLMDSCSGRAGRLYGYDTVDIDFQMQPDGAVKLNFEERKQLPTADQIEKAYDHSTPIKEQHLIPKVSA